MKNIFRWKHNGGRYRKPTEHTLVAPSGKDAATIFVNPADPKLGLAERFTWHTWDEDGTGGENAVDQSLEIAKSETWAAVGRQKFHGPAEHLSKYAHGGIGTEDYACLKTWPQDCMVQCGGRGLVFPGGHLEKVLSKKTKDPLKGLTDAIADTDTYETAFFEAFPNNPSTFIRGEGKTIEDAEASAWKQFQKFSACKGHEYEKRGYKNGAGFCKNCGMFKSKVFEPEPGY